jgi:hypothetical protein
MKLRILALVVPVVFGAAQAVAQKESVSSGGQKWPRPSLEVLMDSMAALPVTVQMVGDQPVRIVWKDGSRVAELQAQARKIELDVPVEIQASSCGKKVTGRFCTLHVRATAVFDRLAWLKHEDVTKVGEDVSNQSGPIEPVYLSGHSNVSLTEAKSGPLLPMTCSSYDWLPISQDKTWSILSLTVDGAFNDILKPANVPSNTDEYFDLTLKRSSQGLHVELPQNILDHVGMTAEVNTVGANIGSLISLDSPATWTIKDQDSACQVRMAGLVDLNELTELIEAPREKALYKPVTLHEILADRDEVFLGGLGQGLRTSRFGGQVMTVGKDLAHKIDQTTLRQWVFLEQNDLLRSQHRLARFLEHCASNKVFFDNEERAKECSIEMGDLK